MPRGRAVAADLAEREFLRRHATDRRGSQAGNTPSPVVGPQSFRPGTYSVDSVLSPTPPPLKTMHEGADYADFPLLKEPPPFLKRAGAPLGARLCDRLLFGDELIRTSVTSEEPAAPPAPRRPASCCGAVASLAISWLVFIMATILFAATLLRDCATYLWCCRKKQQPDSVFDTGFAEMLRENGAILLDVRNPDEVTRNKIPGSIDAPCRMSDDAKHTMAQIVVQLGEKTTPIVSPKQSQPQLTDGPTSNPGQSPGQLIWSNLTGPGRTLRYCLWLQIVYCEVGIRSARAKDGLIALGFTRVMNGGSVALVTAALQTDRKPTTHIAPLDSRRRDSHNLNISINTEGSEELRNKYNFAARVYDFLDYPWERNVSIFEHQCFNLFQS